MSEKTYVSGSDKENWQQKIENCEVYILEKGKTKSIEIMAEVLHVIEHGKAIVIKELKEINEWVERIENVTGKKINGLMFIVLTEEIV